MREWLKRFTERRSLPSLDQLHQDVRYAVRGLRRAPGFTSAVVITLGLGIGANAAMFNVVDRLMFRSLAYMRDPATVHRLYLQWENRGVTVTGTSMPYARFLDLRNGTSSFSQMAGFSERDLAVGEGKKSERSVAVGKQIAAKAKEAGITRVVFDRAGYKYHGRVKAVADGAREGGLEF